GHGGERLPFEVTYCGGNRLRDTLAIRGQGDEERAPVGWVDVTHQVPAPGQPVERAGQRRWFGRGGGRQRAHGPPPAVGEVGEQVDVRRRQVKIGQPGAERLQGGVGRPVQGEDHAHQAVVVYHDIGLYDIVLICHETGRDAAGRQGWAARGGPRS